MRFADIDGFHPNVNTIKDYATLTNKDEYCRKAPLTTFVQGVIPKPKEKPNPKKTIIQELNKGTPISTLLLREDLQEFMLLNSTKVKQYETMFKMARQSVLLPWPKVNMNPTSTESRILHWLAMNLDWRERSFKQNQLYLWSERPNMGKTSLLEILQKSIRTYPVPLATHWMDGFDDTYDLMIFEEWAGQVQLSLMNQILDGQICQIPMRGTTFVKTKNIPVIICSNVPPYESYKHVHMDRLGAFEARLLVCKLDSFIEIFQCQKRQQ